jgi:asparaginyl-tRNA synthetase
MNEKKESSTMTSTTSIATIADYLGQPVKLQGWLIKQRSSGKILFLQIRDGSGIIQAVVFKPDVDEAIFNKASSLTQECSLWVEGIVRRDERSALGYELSVTDLGLIGESADYPIAPKEHGVAFLMEHRHLWMRSAKQVAILKIRACLVRAIRQFFDERGFVNTDAPLFTPNACEGSSTLFEVDYFERQAYLSQSGQLYMEATAMALGKVYCFGPVFRSEKSKTRRHLTEFWMVEPEMTFVEHDENIATAETLIAFAISTVVKECRQELITLERDIAKLEAIQAPFPRITYDEALALLQQQGHTETQWGDDLGGDEETIISKQFDKPVIIERYPHSLKPFYMKRDPNKPEVVLNMDILAPEGYGEIVGGSQREDCLDTLLIRLEQHHLNPNDFGWYLDLRRYGSVPHAGFGMGLERMVAWVCGLHHVRECIPFARLMDRMSP